MLTRRGIGVGGSSLGLWIVSRTFGIPELAMVATAGVVLIVLGVIHTRVASAHLAATRWISSTRLHHGQTAEVEVRLRNLGRLPTALIEVVDSPPTPLATPPRVMLRPLPAGTAASWRYPLHAGLRGRWEFGDVQIWLRDPFGLAARPRSVEVADEVVVFPPVVALPPGLPLAGHIGTGVKGQPRPTQNGDDLAMVREYVRGDDLRKVHWRSTAHRGKLMVRQDESPQRPTATIVLDARKAGHHGVGAASSMEYAVTAAASTTVHLAARAFQAQLLTEPLTSPPVAVTAELALEQLAGVEPLEGDRLDLLWQQLATGTAGSGTLIVIMPAPAASELRALVRAGRGFPARSALIIDAHSFRRRRSRAEEDQAKVAARALGAAGWRVAIQAAGQPLDAVWQDLVFQRPSREGVA